MDNKDNPINVDYDPVADEYADEYFHELDHKPLDRKLLDELGVRVGSLGPICDLGCGPGQMARYFYNKGIPSLGVDLSAKMVEKARQLSPEIEFIQGDMQALEIPDDSWGGIAAFYCLIHIPHNKMVSTLKELRRVLKPGGWLLAAFHIGDEVHHYDEYHGKEISIDTIFFLPEQMQGYIKEAGFENLEITERGPYPRVEYNSRRAYIFAQKV